MPDLPEATEHFRTDLSRDLAALHEICATHSDELRTLSNERGSGQVRDRCHVLAQTSINAVLFHEAHLSPRLISAACIEKDAGHHRAPPAEAGSVCHVQQQQVVLHSSSPPILPILASSLRVQPGGDMACSTLITMATHPPFSIMSSSDSPAHPTHLPSCLVHHKRAMQQQQLSTTGDGVL